MASPELEALLQRLASGGGQSQPDPDDPPVMQYKLTPTGPARGFRGRAKSYAAKSYQVTKTPLSRAKNEFFGMDRDELKRFQELAFQAGYYGSSAEREDVPFGSYDEKTYQVWAQLNERAAMFLKNGKQHTVWDVLQDDVNNRPESLGKKKGRERAPLVTELPDPRALEELVRGVAPEVLGRDPDPAFTQDFIAMYSRIVREYQENKYALENTEKGGTITAPPSAEMLASFRLRTENPEQFEEKRAAARSAAYTALLKGAL